MLHPVDKGATLKQEVFLRREDLLAYTLANAK